MVADFKDYNPSLFINFQNLSYSEICISLICCYLRQSINQGIIKERNFLKYYEWPLIISTIIESNSEVSNSILLFLTKLNILEILSDMSSKTKEELRTTLLLHFNHSSAFSSLNRKVMQLAEIREDSRKWIEKQDNLLESSIQHLAITPASS